MEKHVWTLWVCLLKTSSPNVHVYSAGGIYTSLSTTCSIGNSKDKKKKNMWDLWLPKSWDFKKKSGYFFHFTSDCWMLEYTWNILCSQESCRPFFNCICNSHLITWLQSWNLNNKYCDIYDSHKSCWCSINILTRTFHRYIYPSLLINSTEVCMNLCIICTCRHAYSWGKNHDESIVFVFRFKHNDLL